MRGFRVESISGSEFENGSGFLLSGLGLRRSAGRLRFTAVSCS